MHIFTPLTPIFSLLYLPFLHLFRIFSSPGLAAFTPTPVHTPAVTALAPTHDMVVKALTTFEERLKYFLKDIEIAITLIKDLKSSTMVYIKIVNFQQL